MLCNSLHLVVHLFFNSITNDVSYVDEKSSTDQNNIYYKHRIFDQFLLLLCFVLPYTVHYIVIFLIISLSNQLPNYFLTAREQ